MMKMFELASKRHSEIMKCAFVGSVVGAAGGYIAKHPIKSLLGGLTVYSTASDMAAGARRLAKPGVQRVLPGMTRTF
ncbi:MAG: hypothetical protein EBZ49_00380 [Proteobacteria bacterium]|nr:hypothetical protein [Pseudomonadota bacterium]